MPRLTTGFTDSPLAKNTVLMMSIRLSLVVTIAALVSYFHIFEILNEQVRDSLQKYIAERGDKESAIFIHAERNHQKFKEQFLKQWKLRKDQPTPEQFERIFVTLEDGGKRLHADTFSGIQRPDGTLSQHITGYIGNNAPKTPLFFNKLLLSYDLIDRYADAWTMDYANLYVSMPENVNLVYWPGVPWGNQAQSDLDVTIEEWVYVADMENNPERKPAWTGLYFDPTADEWMVSLATPVDDADQHLINIGHDILLNTLFERVFNDKLAGTYNFIFRQDGRIIAHPGLVEELRQHKGVLNAEDAGDPLLLNSLKLINAHQVTGGGKISIVDDEKADALLAVTQIEGPDWYFVTFYPKSLLTSTALQTAYIVSIIGIVSLIVELIILFFVLKGQVLEPIGTFHRFSRDMGRGRFESIEELKKSKTHQRDDEIGELAQTMVDMATTIKGQEIQLVKQVAEKTKELRESNQSLEQESKSRKEILALLQTIATDVSGLQGDDYFSTLGQFLADSLDADLVIICRLSKDRSQLNTLTAFRHKKLIPNLSYPVEGTPCEVVINKGPQLYNGNVQEMFPADQDLVDLDVHAYIGTPMLDSSGQAIGHLAVMKSHLFSESDKARMVINSVSSRAASELMRHVNEEIITRQASTDSLTELANRDLFLDRLSQAIFRANRNQSQLAVIFIDFDNFKLVNDQLGHSVGDKLLKVFADRLRTCIRQEDTVARFGGDEFIVLLNDSKGIHGPENVTRNIQQEIAKQVSVEDTFLTLSCSMGVSIYPEDGSNIDELINHADTAMYRAKELGRNNVQFFTREMNQLVESRRKTEHDLRQAISRQEFKLYYQPILCLKNNAVKKLEALIRWQHPEKGLISPDQFISIAEQTGQIVAIGDFVMEQACRDFETLKDQFRELQAIAINCSPRQFQNPDFPDQLERILKESELDSENIELEITENLFIDRDDCITGETLKKIRGKGFRFSLDDFGTGYSSLVYLKQLPLHCLKIDREFIADINRDPASLNLVKSIIDIAHNFQFKVVAEGVESEEHSAILRDMGCNFAQGYYYCPPQPIETLISRSFKQSSEKSAGILESS